MTRLLLALCLLGALTAGAQLPDYRNAALLDSVIHYGKTTSVLKDSVDWPRIEKTMQAIHDTSGLVPATQFMLKELEDFHGRIFYQMIPYNGVVKPWTPSSMEFDSLTMVNYRYAKEPVRAELLSPHIGYISIPTIKMGMDSLNALVIYNCIDSLQQASDGLKGFVVDLRLNGGGTMFPMLTGMSPFFGSGAVGYFLDPAQGYKEGWLLREGDIQFQLEGEEPYWTSNYGVPAKDLSALPIAVLTSRATSSSGEVCTIAFKGRPNTRSFGEPTSGYTTSVSWRPLNEEVVLQVTEAYYADRNSTLYPATPVPPDVELSGPARFDNLLKDSYVQTAMRWLMER